MFFFAFHFHVAQNSIVHKIIACLIITTTTTWYVCPILYDVCCMSVLLLLSSSLSCLPLLLSLHLASHQLDGSFLSDRSCSRFLPLKGVFLATVCFWDVSVMRLETIVIVKNTMQIWFQNWITSIDFVLTFQAVPMLYLLVSVYTCEKCLIISPEFLIKSSFAFVCFSSEVMTQTVQTNGVQPLSKTWELSLYELQRTPQVTIHILHIGPRNWA